MKTNNIIPIKAVSLIYGLPFKIYDRIEELKKRRRCCIEKGAHLYLQSRINSKNGRESIKIGRGSQLLCHLETYYHGGKITIGEFCFIGENTYIWSMSEVSIGSRVLISHDVNIHDTNSHSLSARERHEHFLDIFRPNGRFVPKNITTRPISVEDDVWIGFGATILKGVTIGKGAVVAARSVVTKDVLPYTVVAGHPAREIGLANL